MKNLKAHYAIALLAFFALAACSPYNHCDRWRMGIYSRGDVEQPFVAGTGKVVSTAETNSACEVTILNKSGQDLNVFIDTVWQGVLKADAKGYVPVAKGNFSYMHATSSDGEFIWSGKGDCGENSTFKITNKE